MILKEIEIADIVKQLQRRLQYIQNIKKLEIDFSELDGIGKQLTSCNSTAELQSIFLRMAKLPNNNPLQWYANDVIQNQKLKHQLEISGTDLKPATDYDEDTYELKESKAREAFAWGQNALLAWEHWSPKIDRGLFNVIYEKEWSPEKNPQEVTEIINNTINKNDQKILILRYYSGIAYVSRAKSIQSKFVELLEGCDDYIFIPLNPTPARWIISYFHHDFLEIGTLTDNWLHGANVSFK